MQKEEREREDHRISSTHGHTQRDTSDCSLSYMNFKFIMPVQYYDAKIQWICNVYGCLLEKLEHPPIETIRGEEDREEVED